MTASRAARVAKLIHDQLVVARPGAAMALWDDPEFAAGEGARFRDIAERIRRMPPDARILISDIVRQVAADTLLDVLHLIAGSRDIGIEEEWALTLDGEDVGGALLDAVIVRESG